MLLLAHIISDDDNFSSFFQDKVSELPTGPQPPFFEKLFNLMFAAGFDRKPENRSFGDVIGQVYPVYRQVGCVYLKVLHLDHAVFSLKKTLIFRSCCREMLCLSHSLQETRDTLETW